MKKNDIDLEIWNNFVQCPRLGEILLQLKKITLSQLTAALDAQQSQNAPIGEIMIQMGIITENELVDVLELQSRIGNILTESFNELKKLKDQ